MIKDTRKNLKVGGSILISLPSALEKGVVSTLAANRIMIVDPRGQISESDLLEFLEEIEPQLWSWLEKKESSGKQPSEART